MTTTEVDNWPADAPTAQGPELMHDSWHMQSFNTKIILTIFIPPTFQAPVHAHCDSAPTPA
jgi:thioredoxin reductase